MSAHETTRPTAFEKILPQFLDEIFTRNRDKACLAWATVEQIRALTRIIPASDHVIGVIAAGRIVAYRVTLPGKEVVHLHSLGDDDTAGEGGKISLPIVGIALGTRLVVTQSGCCTAGLASPAARADFPPAAPSICRTVAMGPQRIEGGDSGVLLITQRASYSTARS